MSNLMALGQRVARMQDELRARTGNAEAARGSFIRSLRRRAARPRRILIAASFIGLLCATMTVFLVRIHPITVRVGSTTPSVGLGAGVLAPPDRVVPLSFSDGSVITLAPGGEAAIASLDHNGGSLRVRRGKAHVQIVHSANTHWALLAGPYAVNVTGTRFDIEWRPESQRLSVDLFRGSVIVSGPDQGSATKLSAGQRLLVTSEGWTVRNSQDPHEVAAAEPAATAPLGVALPDAAEKSDSSREGSAAVIAAAPVTMPRSWTTFAAHGDYRGAFDAAEHEGFENVCRRSSSAELLSLAEAARFTGHDDRAKSALQILRSRFKGSHDAALAAFQLGRLAGGGYASARWFRTYLQEQKGGELAREASGRLLEALWQAGDGEGARAEARDYLRTYPQGPHAAFAQRLLNQQPR